MFLRFVVLVGGLVGLSPCAFAQETPDQVIQQSEVDQIAPPEEIDRVAPPQRGGFRAPDGVRVVQPGALLFASFDRNYDGRVTVEEMEAGAAGSFVAADRNKDGVITGFEQNDWAASVASMNDVLSNPMTFDADLDRSVTKEEFVSGLEAHCGPGCAGRTQLCGSGEAAGASRRAGEPRQSCHRRYFRGPRGPNASPSARN